MRTENRPTLSRPSHLPGKVSGSTFNPFVGPSLRTLAAVFLILAAIGCGSGQPPRPVPQSEIPSRIRAAFQSGSDETLRLAEDAVAALERDDLSRAFVFLQSLAARPELDRRQRELVTGSILEVSQRLRDLSESGDRRAAELMNLHQSMR